MRLFGDLRPLTFQDSILMGAIEVYGYDLCCQFYSLRVSISLGYCVG